MGKRVSTAVLPTLCTNEVPGSIPGPVALCAFGFQSILAFRRFFSGYSGLPRASKLIKERSWTSNSTDRTKSRSQRLDRFYDLTVIKQGFSHDVCMHYHKLGLIIILMTSRAVVSGFWSQCEFFSVCKYCVVQNSDNSKWRLIRYKRGEFKNINLVVKELRGFLGLSFNIGIKKRFSVFLY